MAKVKGIDVSYHNGTIDWKKVAAAGIKFAVLREGYRKTIDTQFLANVKGAVANGIPVMVYHFIYTDGATIKENAKSTVDNMKKAGLDPASTWVWTDLEYDTWKKNGEKCTRAACSKYTQDYINELKALGCKKIGVYMNNDYYKNYYSEDIIKGYPVWLADYNGDADHACAIHQYGSTGKVDGINSTSVDMNYLMDESLIRKEEKKMSYIRSVVVGIMQGWIGKSRSAGTHHDIIDCYNTIKPLPRGYKVTYSDAYCATTVSAAFHKAGYDAIFPLECGCGAMIDAAKKMGIWQESDAYVPSPGDCVLYDWDDDGKGDCTGYPEHVGMVENCNGKTITVMEGNMSGGIVGRRTLAVNGRYIRGFVVPKFTAAAPQTTSTPSNTGSTSSGTTLNRIPKYNGVVTTALNVRTWAGTEYGKCTFSPLPKGAVVGVCDTIQAKDGSKWHYIKYNGKYGFSHSAYIKKQS